MVTIGTEKMNATEARDFAAKAAGFSSTTKYRQARKAVEHGVPELVKLMDAGQVSVDAAAEVACYLSPDEQREAVALGPREVKAWASAIRQARKELRGPR